MLQCSHPCAAENLITSRHKTTLRYELMTILWQHAYESSSILVSSNSRPQQHFVAAESQRCANPVPCKSWQWSVALQIGFLYCIRDFVSMDDLHVSTGLIEMNCTLLDVVGMARKDFCAPFC